MGMVLDIIIHAIASHARTSTSAFAMLGFLVILRLLMVVGTFGIVWNTVLFRFGLLGMLCNRLTPLAILLPLSTLLTVVMGGIRGALLSDDDSGGLAGVYDENGVQTLMFF